jgi:hypothetical protein
MLQHVSTEADLHHTLQQRYKSAYAVHLHLVSWGCIAATLLLLFRGMCCLFAAFCAAGSLPPRMLTCMARWQWSQVGRYTCDSRYMRK